VGGRTILLWEESDVGKRGGKFAEGELKASLAGPKAGSQTGKRGGGGKGDGSAPNPQVEGSTLKALTKSVPKFTRGISRTE